jgi:hypothetical protein
VTEIKEVTERLNTKSMWMFYVDDLHKQINTLKRNMGGTGQAFASVIKYIEENQDFISLATNKNVDYFKEVTTTEQIEQIVYNGNVEIAFEGEKKKTLLTIALHKLVKLKKESSSQKKQFEALKAQDITYQQYAFILKEFNVAIVDKIIEGYRFNPGFNIGEIGIKQKERRIARVNWGESYKLRKALLADGETLYDKDKHPEGKRWLIYFTDDNAYWVYWNKAKCKIKNKLYYSFIPVSGGNEYDVVAKLHRHIKNNPEVVLQYT